jgi:cysteine-rich repeat protein
MSGQSCGNGIVEAGESCDDGNTAAGDGCSSACDTEPGTSPRLNVMSDKPTIATELKTTHQITLTLSGVGGFGETVNLAGTAVDMSDAPLVGWTVTFASPTVDVPMNGTVTTVATLKIPSKNVGLAGKVKLDVSSTLGTQTVTTDVTALNQVTFSFKVDPNIGCVFPADAGNAANKVPLSIGTKIRWFNEGTAGVDGDFVIHVNSSPVNGVTHQNQSPNGLADPTTEPGTAYEQVSSGTPGATLSWYCHAPGPNANATTDPAAVFQ